MPAATQEPIALYFWPTPNGFKPAIFLEEAGLTYTVKPVNIGEGDQFKPDFLAISPNNKMPALVDPQGPDGAPISVFESGAILQYLARKTGQFGGATERERVEIEQWLHWQIGGLGPMAGQAHHFNAYAPMIETDPARLAYGQDRYTREVARLYGVLNTRLADRDYIAGAYSIADMAAWPWTRSAETRQRQDIEAFPHVKAWRARVEARPAVRRALALGETLTMDLASEGPDADRARAVLFGRPDRA